MDAQIAELMVALAVGEEQLEPRQLAAAESLALGNTQAKTAEAVHVSRSTISYWLTLPVFSAYLLARKKALWAAAEDRLRGAVLEAVDCLVSECRSGNVDAAIAILKTTKLWGRVGAPVGSTDPTVHRAKQTEARGRVNDSARFSKVIHDLQIEQN